MKEQLVNFETAKLAKEKGFQLKRNYFGYIDQFYEPKTKNIRHFGLHGRTPIKDLIYIPTQSLLQKWLREKHNIQMILKPFYDSLKKENSFVCDVIRISDGRVIKSPRMLSYEEALEIGLQEALTLI